MWRNYVTVGFRALLKNRTYAFINIFGLAVGLAACLMLLLYVRYETSYDEWLPNAENVYQLQTFYEPQSNGEELKLQMSSFVSGEALQRDFPEVERRVYVFSAAPTVMRGGNALNVENGVMVDGPFFDIFQFPFVRGDRATALTQAGSVVLSQSEARRLFGAEDPVGKTLTLIVDGGPVDHRVTGVFRDLPRNSHMRFNMIVRFDPQSFFAEDRAFLTSYSNQGGWVYVALRPGTDPEAIHSRMPEWERRNIPDESLGRTTYNAGEEQDYRLVNVRDVHLGAAQQGAMTPGNDRATIVTFAIIAALILFMACVNFTNLATARAMQRAREVAVRKVLGARRQQLMVQFLTESVLVASVAMIVALALVELLLPRLSAFLDANLTLTYFGSSGILVPTLVLILLVGALGGLYPAFYLSRFQPARVLKANKSSAETEGAGRLRNILVVAQFAVSIGLIICTAVVFAQAQHARTVDPGFKRDGLIQIANLRAESLEGQRDALAREIARVEGVTSVGRTGIGISTGNSSSTGVQLPGQAESVPLGTYAVDARFFPTMGIRLLAGRQFDENRPRDDASLPPGGGGEAMQALAERGVNVVINRLAARSMGFNDPADAIGKTASIAAPGPQPTLIPLTIIGVFEDSRFRSARTAIEPIVFRQSRDETGWMVVRYESGADPAAVRARIQAVWKRFADDVPFEAEFSQDIVAELYQAETARAQTFAGFALLAIVIACLGLFGLAAFTAERRTKEIGIRKVFGARSRDIVRLLAWQFSKPVIIANIVAWPAAWWVMRDWLNGFDARVDLGPAPFLLAGFIALAIAIGTIAGHAIKVARANPIHALRYE